MDRYGVIDIGTNSIKFHIGEREANGTWRTVVDTADLSRLGEGLQQSGIISTEASERNVQAIVRMADEARRLECKEIVAVGTMALRMAKNSSDFVRSVKERAGVDVEIISGDEEIRYSYLAVKNGLGLSRGRMVIFDTGGGSTEFVFGKDSVVERRFSLNIGAIRFTESYFTSDPVSQAELDAAILSIEQELEELKSVPQTDILVGMGGTMTNIGGVKHKLAKYDPDIVQGSEILKSEIKDQIDLYRSKTIEERKGIVGLQPKRADVILAGVCIVWVIMSHLNMKSVFISDRGLRHGLISDRFK